MHSNSIPESTVIGNYRIERHLGSGGMADVYLATHLLVNKQYAIKVMKPSVDTENPIMAKRFIREAQLAQKVDNPNIVKVSDVGTDDLSAEQPLLRLYPAERPRSDPPERDRR